MLADRVMPIAGGQKIESASGLDIASCMHSKEMTMKRLDVRSAL
jgi:hypothetical protein